MSDCVCVYDNCFGDEPDFCDRQTPKARKEHECYECLQTIAVGQQHERYTGKWDGTISRYRTCLLCVEIRNAFFCDGFTFGGVWDEIEDQMFRERGIDSACLDKLKSVEAKQFLQRRWWEWVGRVVKNRWVP